MINAGLTVRIWLMGCVMSITEEELARPIDDADLDVWTAIARQFPLAQTSAVVLRLISEVRRLQGENEVMSRNHRDMRTQRLVVKLAARVQELEAALKKYGEHQGECGFTFCRCGFRAVLEKMQ